MNNVICYPDKPIDKAITIYNHPHIQIQLKEGDTIYKFDLTDKAADDIWLALGQLRDKKFEI